MGVALAFMSRYHSGICQPARRAVSSTRSRDSLCAVLANTAPRTAPPGRVTRMSSVNPAAGSKRWFNTKAATQSSTVQSASGSAQMSATAAGGLPAAFHANMSREKSTPIGRAPCSASAEQATPVPAPTSRTTRPASE